MTDVLLKDARRSANSCYVSADTAIALLDKDGSPTRDLNRGYTATRALAHLRTARTEARKAEELLALLEEGGPRE